MPGRAQRLLVCKERKQASACTAPVVHLVAPHSVSLHRSAASASGLSEAKSTLAESAQVANQMHKSIPTRSKKSCISAKSLQCYHNVATAGCLQGGALFIARRRYGVLCLSLCSLSIGHPPVTWVCTGYGATFGP